MKTYSVPVSFHVEGKNEQQALDLVEIYFHTKFEENIGIRFSKVGFPEEVKGKDEIAF